MDYEKKYKEALERAKKAKNNVSFNAQTHKVLDIIFPELKESEDEHIRKCIIAILDNYVDNSNTFKPKMLAWLEKQGEQKETICDKCKKEQPSHSCQDITALGRCALEKQGEKKLTEYLNDCVKWLYSLKQRIKGE